MAHRNSNVEKYNKKWFQDLSKNAKLLYYYLNDKVDIGGFWCISKQHILYEAGLCKEEADAALSELEGKGIIIFSDDADYLWLTTFIEEQNNYPLNPQNRCYRGIFSKMRRIRIFQNQKDVFDKIEVITADDEQSATKINHGLIDYMIQKGLM
jgi:hypothetical protein